MKRLILLLASLPSPAWAGEGERVLSLIPAYGAWSVNQGEGRDRRELAARGGQLVLGFERGLNDTMWLRGSAMSGIYSASDGAVFMTGGLVGVTYALDVFRYVPYATFGAGAFVVFGNGVATAVEPVVQLGFGLDVLESRRFSWGIEGTVDTFLSASIFWYVGPRISYRWGFF